MLGSNGLLSEAGEEIPLVSISEIFHKYPISTNAVELARDYENIFSYPLRYEEQIGERIDKYNGAERINTFRTKGVGIKNPNRFGKILEFCERLSGITPSHGLKTNPDYNNSDSIVIPILIEYDNGNSLAVFYFDEKRSISYTKIQKVESAILDANLSGGLIIYNIHGMQAERELQRINELHGDDSFLTMVRFSEVENALYY